MAELKSLTIGGNTYDSFVDQVARAGMGQGGEAAGIVRYDQEQNLFEEQKSQARENIGATAIHIGAEPPADPNVTLWLDIDEEGIDALGDIAAALDAIIEIQNSLIGGDGT